MNHIRKLLREAIGLDAASVGVSLIERTVRLRMKSRGLKQTGEYYKILRTTAAELKELIESVVVTETWFFRDKETFAALARVVINDWLPARPTGLPAPPVCRGTGRQRGGARQAGQPRVLSVPCASGEEPYSIAMTLLDAGLKAERFEVHAVDISERMLAHAQRGVYGKNSFRGKDLGFRNRHFTLTKEGYRLADPVRDCVRFEQGNVLAGKCLAQCGHYDFVFCRNLLIYFDRETQARVVKKLGQLLAPDGLCFVGAAELPLVLNHGFVSANLPMAFACRKADLPRGVTVMAPGSRADSNTPRGEPAPPQTQAQPRRAKVAKAGPRLAQIPVRLSEPPLQPLAKVIPPAQGERRDSARGIAPTEGKVRLERIIPRAERASQAALDTAERLADEGKLADAAKICQAHLETNGPSAGAYYLLGLVHDAGNDTARAEDFYRKSLYLEPSHCEALLNLALLKEKAGDAAAARVLRQRARRTAKPDRDLPRGVTLTSPGSVADGNTPRGEPANRP